MGTFITEDFTVAENESLSFQLNSENDRASAFVVGDWNAIEGQVYFEPTVINFGELILLPTPGFTAGSFFQYNSGMSWEVATFENYGSILVDMPDMNWARVLTAPGGGSPEITNNGSITVLSGDDANVFWGSRPTVTNGAQGTIYAEGDGRATAVEGLAAEIINEGTIRVHIRGGTTFPEAEASMALLSKTGGMIINNSGLIEATATFDYQRAIAIQSTVSGPLTLINTGTIRATDAIIHIEGGSFIDGIGSDIDNSGLIDGNITLMERPDTVENTGEIRGLVKLEGGDDVFDGSSGLVIGSISGGEGDDIIRSGEGSDLIIGGLGNDTLDGGSNVDTAVFAGNRADYFSIIETAMGIWQIRGPDGRDTLSNIEILRFDDLEVQLDLGDGLAVDPGSDAPNTFMVNIRDFDGKDVGAAFDWVLIGEADANLDGSADYIFVNRVNGRFAEVGVDENGLVQFDNFGQGGDTRVVGIYIDPEVAAGNVEQGSPFDSQQRFQNDLFIGNIAAVLGSQDYDGDGFAEVYFALTDGTAYLRALMHADGNIQYANYQSEEQVIEYLNSQGFGEETYGTWFGDNQSSQSSGFGKAAASDVALLPTPVPGMMSADMDFMIEMFG